MKVLIIEDNETIAKTVERALRSNYRFEIANTGEEGLRRALSSSYGVILLDLNLPDMNGDQICREIRKQKIDTPIIVLSGKGEVSSKISLLNMGADDYVTKPFNLEELRARIDVAMRHTGNVSPSGKLIEQDLVLDPAARSVSRNGFQIELRRKEFDLLELLMRNKGQTLTRVVILDHIWDINENLWANVIDVHIKHLRDKIDRPYGSKFIKTVHGIGYKFDSAKS